MSYRSSKTVRLLILWMLAVLIISGCVASRPDEAEVIAAHATEATEIALLRQTVTYEADQRKITMEYLATSATRTTLRQLAILATMSALGLDTSNIRQITPAATATPVIEMIMPTVNDPLAGGGGVTRLPSTPDFRTPLPTNTPLAPTATADPNAPTLTNIVTSNSVGSDDCATQVTNQFSSGAAEIYVVATANRIPAGATLGSRWQRDGEEIAFFSFTPDFNIDGACIWFFAAPSDFEFTPGTGYSVTLEIDGTAAADPVTFQIVE